MNSNVRYKPCSNCGMPCNGNNTSLVPVISIYLRKGLRHGYMTQKRVCSCGATVEDPEVERKSNKTAAAMRETFHIRFPEFDAAPVLPEENYKLHEMYMEVV